MDRPTFVPDIEITAGTNDKYEKADDVTRAFAVIESMLGPLHPANCIMIHEVAADAWGYRGVPGSVGTSKASAIGMLDVTAVRDQRSFTLHPPSRRRPQ